MTSIRKLVFVTASALSAMFITGCESHIAISSVDEPQTQNGERTMVSEASMENLDFLIGRWTGSTPDGSTFYEEYVATDATTLRSLRYDDATFANVIDSSTVALRWQDYVNMGRFRLASENHLRWLRSL